MKKKEIENGILHLSANDSLLATIIKKAGNCNLKPHTDYYNSLLDAIIGQQLSMKAAQSIIRKFTTFFGGYPPPETLILTEDTVLRSLGLSNAKVKYVKDLSAKVLEGSVILSNFGRKSDDDIIAELTKVKGIGVWTAHMFLIFTLGRPNVLPTLDLGIRKAVMKTYSLKILPDDAAIHKIAKKRGWEPYRTLASWYLWKSLEFKES